MMRRATLLTTVLASLLAISLAVVLGVHAQGTATGAQVYDKSHQVASQEGDQAGDSASGDMEPNYTASITVPQEESAKLASLARISAGQAIAKALEANPGTQVVKAELEDENGYLVYSVSLNNGLDVKVDAGTGQIIHTEKDTAEDREGKAEKGKDHERGPESKAETESESEFEN